MTPIHFQGFLRRADVRLAAFGLSAISAVYLGFIGISAVQAERLLRIRGYYLILATAGLFGWACWRMFRESGVPGRLTRRESWLAGLAIAAFSLLAINAEPYSSKILNDEYVLQSTAFNLHHFREVAAMVRAYEIDGVFISTDNYLDKRPAFYPFLVSLLHDVTGYRPLNAYLVNSLLLPVALGLAFVFGRMLAGFRGGMLALFFLGTLPLLGQNATGAGMELTNAVMILAVLVLGAAYLERPTETRLAVLLLATVLLAQSRYESALFVLATALVTIAGWLRERRIVLPWTAALVPLLLLPVALQNKVVASMPVLWELNERGDTRFAVEYFAGNFRGAVAYLFNRSPERSNSLILSAVGLVALGWAFAAVVVRLRRLHHTAPARLALIAISLVILTNTLLVLCYYWARFDEPVTSRFSLPLHLLLTFAAVAFASRLDRRAPATRILLVVVGFFSTAIAAGKYSSHYYSRLGADEFEWQLRRVNELAPGSRLVITGLSTMPWLLQKTPSIMIGRARQVADRLEFQLRAGDFRQILVMQTLRPTSADGGHAPAPDDMLPEWFNLEPVAEKRFGTRLSRISRLVAVDLPADRRPAPAVTPPTRSAE